MKLQKKILNLWQNFFKEAILRLNVPKNEKGKIGIVIAIDTENQKEKIRLENDLLFNLKKYLEESNPPPLIESIAAALERTGITTTVMARDYEEWGAQRFSPEELMAATFKAIDAADFLLVEFSEKGVGLGIEAGYAYAKGKPIVVIARVGSDVSSTLRGIAKKVVFYNEVEEIAENISIS